MMLAADLDSVVELHFVAEDGTKIGQLVMPNGMRFETGEPATDAYADVPPVIMLCASRIRFVDRTGRVLGEFPMKAMVSVRAG